MLNGFYKFLLLAVCTRVFKYVFLLEPVDNKNIFVIAKFGKKKKKLKQTNQKRIFRGPSQSRVHAAAATAFRPTK